MAQTSNRLRGSHTHRAARDIKYEDTRHASNQFTLEHHLADDVDGCVPGQPMILPQDLSFMGYHDNESGVWDHALQHNESKAFDPSGTTEFWSADLHSSPFQGWSHDGHYDTRYPMSYEPSSIFPSPPISSASLPASLSQLGSLASRRGYIGPIRTTSSFSESVPALESSDSQSSETWNYYSTQSLLRDPWTGSPTMSIKEETNSMKSEYMENITNSPRPRGRHGKLTDEKRSKAAMMRRLGSCDTCKRRKSSCDEHTPCASCISYYGQKLPENPCRGQFVTKVRDLLLNTRIKWHASPDFLGHSRGRQILPINDKVPNLPISFGGGPPMNVEVQIILSVEHSVFQHHHVTYSDDLSFIQSSQQQEEVVLPAIIPDQSSLDLLIDDHFDKLTYKFLHLPSIHCSINLLTPINGLYQYFLTTSLKGHAKALHYALKLLLIVQIGRDVKVPSPAISSQVHMIFQQANLSPPSNEGDITPCFLRADLGGMMPSVAKELMTWCLEYLERLQLGKRCEDFPVVLALMLVMAKVIEGIQIHGTRDGLHDPYNNELCYNDKHAQEMRAERETSGNLARINGDKAFEMLLRMHSITFRNCHNQLQRYDPNNPHSNFSLKPGSGRSRSNSADSALGNDPQTQFVQEISFEIFRNKPYLEERAMYEPAKGVGMDFADRLVSRVLLLR